MKYEVKFTNQFKKDLKLARKQNRDLDKLFAAVNILAGGGTLDAKYRDHDKKGITNPDYCVLKFTVISGRYYCDLKNRKCYR